MILSPKTKRLLFLLLFFYVLLLCLIKVESNCKSGCDLAIASYYVWEGSNLTYITNIFTKKLSQILPYNPDIHNPDSSLMGTRIHVPFSCECMNGDFLGHTFTYITQTDDTYDKIARVAFANLTNIYWLQRVNKYDPTRIPDFVPINVTVNCSCGDQHVSKDYGLFSTYPLRPGQNLSSVAAESGVSPELLQSYNPGSDFGAGYGLVFVPAKELGLLLLVSSRNWDVAEEEAMMRREGNCDGEGRAASDRRWLIG
ncbi:hypothetical protein TEA_009523 [Camellia sinensis var. sinensis]|uniref:LYK3/RLK10-like LysM domain-containing protein n=1 Tax=Camellia sinensis var. sinensis TaxID=542762 RepID=A0A4S4EX65_CAMSN|nr:hypothetical protein TEA_009523 [Camellia sinensis var. sinensis]